MQTVQKTLVLIGIRLLILVPILSWVVYYLRGRQFALRDHLDKADAVVVLAGSRGSLEFLHSKVRTGVDLYQKGWVSHIIFTGKFSRKITENPTLIPLE